MCDAFVKEQTLAFTWSFIWQPLIHDHHGCVQLCRESWVPTSAHADRQHGYWSSITKSHGRLLRYHTRGKDSEIMRLFQDALMIWKLEVLASLWCDQLGDVCWHINTFRCHILSSLAHTWFLIDEHLIAILLCLSNMFSLPMGHPKPTFCVAKKTAKPQKANLKAWRRISLVLGQQITELEIWLPAPGETYTLGAHWQIRPPSM